MPLGLRSLPGGGGALVINAVERVRITADADSPLEMLVDGTMRKVVESGSNANGSWARFADGTQICQSTPTSTLTTSISVDAPLHLSAAVAFTFPVGFAVAPLIHPHAVRLLQHSVWAGMTSDSEPTTTGVDGYRLVGYRSNSTGFMSITVIGRWY